ncbi:PP2C family protein-serine/threonine phosphatase [Georgenia sp. SUBG003]|uniref:PP2C family protein-serine/threonine phosphatase n=1 Tax=Georgenia sp. SUBG003 TaxID=1497974 RepID=UPI0004D344B3|nr:hypothetical protein DA06_05660 [Georgenia sp. SUBG003]
MGDGEAARVAALHALNMLDTPREERFDRVVRLAQAVFGVPMAAVTLIDTDRQWHKASVGFGDFAGGPRSEAFCHHTIQRPGTTVVPDATQDDRFAANPAVVGDLRVRFYAGEPLRAPGGEPVGALCIVDTEPRELTTSQEAVLREMARIVEHELAADDEMDRAREMQRLLLPSTTPPLPGYELAGRCVPARGIGGDFFDWYLLDDELQVHVADVMGKGVPAALVAASVRAMLRGSSRFNDLENTVHRVAQGLDLDLQGTDTFVTAFSARLDPATDVLHYVDAGHGLVGVARPDGSHRKLDASGPPIGAVPDVTWTAHSTRLDPGETLIVVSDGFLDLFATEDEARAVAAEVSVNSSTVVDLVEEFTRYASTVEPEDDLTVLALRRVDA